MSPAPPRFSVIIPTYQRRDLVVRAVSALSGQCFAGGFEVLVVVDGSTDGTAAALRALRVPFPLTVLEQPNRGAAAARSAGGYAAMGEILLFLDDDMEADPRLLAEHDRSHREGAGVVLGNIPLHPDSAPGLLGAWVREWVDRRARRLSTPGAGVRVSDLVGGQVSVPRDAFHRAGGFDARLRCGEDVDFGYRVLRHGYRAVFNPLAISRQRYTATAEQFLAQWRESGRASVRLARKHPEIGRQIVGRALNRRRFHLLARVPGLSLVWLAKLLIGRGRQGPITRRVVFAAQALEYCRGVREAGGIPRPRPLRVLAYHAITDVTGAGAFGRYCVRPVELGHQITAILRAGYHFVSGDEVVQFLRQGGGLPRRPVLLTFDDCFEGVVDHALPLLQKHGIPAVAFVVTGRMGGTNVWARSPGAPRLPLADEEGVRRLARSGVEIGAHSRTHPQLPTLGAAELCAEVGGAREDLEALGVGQPRVFAYPYGEADDGVRRAVEMAGYQAAFTAEPGVVHPGADPYRLPRIEILRADVGWRFRRKVALGGRLAVARTKPSALVRELWRRWVHRPSWTAPGDRSGDRPVEPGAPVVDQ